VSLGVMRCVKMRQKKTMKLEKFKQKFQNLKKQGFVKSLRKGPIGVGYTFKTLLELKENNLALPDINGIEIKAHRDNSKSMLLSLPLIKKHGK
jgi:hypothetical protein